MTTNQLRDTVDAAREKHGGSMTDYTVLSSQNDPFRLDTPAHHRNGRWLAETAARMGLGAQTIHLRGLHYRVIGEPKPDGEPYTNTDNDWTWIQEKAGKAARWLGYVDFEQIVDQRNAAPQILEHTEPEPAAYISTGLDIQLPSPDDFRPVVSVGDFRARQQYRLVLVGEKSSLEPVLAPIAARRHADLYLPTGEMSDTMIHRMAAEGAADGRDMIVFYFSDADPAGWQMPISVARKLQAFEHGFYPELNFEVHRVALTPDHVREYGLPSTPLKETEKRADAWTAATGTEQTEIDALAALRPELLTELAEEAIAPYFDRSLERRVREARQAFLVEANRMLAEQLDQQALDRLREDAAARLPEIEEALQELADRVRIDPAGIDLPTIVIPEPVNDTDQPDPLVASWWGFAEGSVALKRSKAYLAAEAES